MLFAFVLSIYVPTLGTTVAVLSIVCCLFLELDRLSESARSVSSARLANGANIQMQNGYIRLEVINK